LAGAAAFGAAFAGAAGFFSCAAATDAPSAIASNAVKNRLEKIV
jgi:hypothetical protein